jgi:hypothetical protein
MGERRRSVRLVQVSTSKKEGVSKLRPHNAERSPHIARTNNTDFHGQNHSLTGKMDKYPLFLLGTYYYDIRSPRRANCCASHWSLCVAGANDTQRELALRFETLFRRMFNPDSAD